MANRAPIECIRKANRLNPHERITHVGGPATGGGRWLWPTERAISEIESGNWSFYVNRGGHFVDVIVATRLGVKYLKTRNDGDSPDNLLSLPECV